VRLGIGGRVLGVRGGISTRGVGVGFGPFSAGTLWRRRRRGGFISAFVALLPFLAATTAACGVTHTSSPATMTVTTTPPPITVTVPEQPTMPAPSMVMPPTEMRQWVNAGQLDFYVDEAVLNDKGVMVAIYVKNTSGVPQTYSTDAQMLRDDQGRLFAPTPKSDEHSGTTIDRFDLNPGMTSDIGFIQYTVPPGTRLDQYTLVVHGSHTSIGSPIHLHEGGPS
jgi:hypothetical protein